MYANRLFIFSLLFYILYLHEDVRSFCLTLHFYSPRAYNYVRGKFDNTLPATSTMRNWYASINASPGFSMEAFECLKRKADDVLERTGSKLLCALMDDEMAIRSHAQWNAASKKFDGFVDLGRNDRTLHPDEDNLPLAKNALVFMISGVEDDFKIPVPYFLVKRLTADEKAAITNELLLRLNAIGIIVVSITFDGHPVC